MTAKTDSVWIFRAGMTASATAANFNTLTLPRAPSRPRAHHHHCRVAANTPTNPECDKPGRR